MHDLADVHGNPTPHTIPYNHREDGNHIPLYSDHNNKYQWGFYILSFCLFASESENNQSD